MPAASGLALITFMRLDGRNDIESLNQYPTSIQFKPASYPLPPLKGNNEGHKMNTHAHQGFPLRIIRQGAFGAKWPKTTWKLQEQRFQKKVVGGQASFLGSGMGGRSTSVPLLVGVTHIHSALSHIYCIYLNSRKAKYYIKIKTYASFGNVHKDF